MKKITIGQLFLICWSIFFSLMCLVMSYYREGFAFCAIVGMLLYMLVCILFSKYNEFFSWLASQKWVYIGVLLLMMTGLLIFSRGMIIKPFNDSGSVWFSVADIVESGKISTVMNEYTSCGWSTHTSNHDYFLVYPNSVFMVESLLPFGYFLKYILHVNLRSTTAYFCLSVLNSCIILTGVIFIILAARREKGNRAALLVLLGSSLFLPYYLNAYKLYSDTMSMPFVGLAIWLITEADHSKERTWWIRLLAGVSLGIGILLKGSVWVLVLACVIYIAVKEKNWKLRVKELVCLLLGVIVVTQIWSIRSNHLPWLDTTQSDRYEMPAMHWIMMASHGGGGFNQQDLDYSMSFTTLDERKAAAMENYIENVKGHGLLGYIKFIVKKVSNTFSDGLYSQQVHLDNFKNHQIGCLVSSDGRFFYGIKTYTTITLCFIYIAVIIASVLNKNREQSLVLLLAICMFGLILFFALWESKSRYLLNFTPLFLLLTAISIEDVSQLLIGLRWDRE